MSLSDQNRALIERELGFHPSTLQPWCSITLYDLNAALDAARDEERQRQERMRVEEEAERLAARAESVSREVRDWLEKISACEVEVYDEDLRATVVVSMTADECADLARKALAALSTSSPEAGWNYAQSNDGERLNADIERKAEDMNIDDIQLGDTVRLGGEFKVVRASDRYKWINIKVGEYTALIRREMIEEYYPSLRVGDHVKDDNGCVWEIVGPKRTRMEGGREEYALWSLYRGYVPWSAKDVEKWERVKK